MIPHYVFVAGKIPRAVGAGIRVRVRSQVDSQYCFFAALTWCISATGTVSSNSLRKPPVTAVPFLLFAVICLLRLRVVCFCVRFAFPCVCPYDSVAACFAACCADRISRTNPVPLFSPLLLLPLSLIHI